MYTGIVRLCLEEDPVYMTQEKQYYTLSYPLPGPEHTMPENLCFEVGNVPDKRWRDSGVVLVYSLSAISSHPLGRTHSEIAETYPYGDFCKWRRHLTNTARCTADTRSTPGKIHVGEKRSIGSNSPIIIGCVTQYGNGLPSDLNPSFEKVKARSRDVTYLEGLRKDSVKDRQEYLLECLETIRRFIAKRAGSVHTLVIPRGMAMSGGLVTEDWGETYIPIYDELARDLLKYNIKTVILDSSGKRRREVLDVTGALNDNGIEDLSHLEGDGEDEDHDSGVEATGGGGDEDDMRNGWCGKRLKSYDDGDTQPY